MRRTSKASGILLGYTQAQWRARAGSQLKTAGVLLAMLLFMAIAVAAEETQASAATIGRSSEMALETGVSPSQPVLPDRGSTGFAGADEAPQVITLWQMMRWGGAILWVIVLLSMVACILAVYYCLTITPGREVPPDFVRRAYVQIRAGDLSDAYQMCEGREELAARVLRSGLKMVGHDRYVIQEAMESEGERGAMGLWHKISHLNSIAVLSPLLGLLGTIWGMMRAFGAIADAPERVKHLSMASGVSKAMVTTFAGLIVAIGALVVYYYLRGQVVKIVSEVEAYASEWVELLARGQQS